FSGTPHGLYLRSMSSGETALIPGTGEYEASEAVFSPDGRWIAFYSIADRALKKIQVTGGAAHPLCDTRVPSGISWGRQGIVFGSGPHRNGIMLVPEDGGQPQSIVRINEGESAHGPQILPGG